MVLLNNGFIVQHGTYRESATITFPISFTNIGTNAIVFNPRTDGGWDGDVVTFCVTNLTASSARFHNSRSWSGSWIAVGY